MSDVIGGRGNKNASCVRIIKPNFYNDCAYFNTKTQRCEKHGIYCKSYIAKKCRDNTVPMNYEYEQRYKIPKIVENQKNHKTKKTTTASSIKISKLPSNKTFIDALSSGVFGKIKKLPADKEREMLQTNNLILKCAQKFNIIIDYDLSDISQQTTDCLYNIISIGDVIEMNNTRMFVLQFLKCGNVFLISPNCKLLKTSVKALNKSRKIPFYNTR